MNFTHFFNAVSLSSIGSGGPSQRRYRDFFTALCTAAGASIGASVGSREDFFRNSSLVP
jgi:hypothetical protein